MIAASRSWSPELLAMVKSRTAGPRDARDSNPAASAGFAKAASLAMTLALLLLALLLLALLLLALLLLALLLR